MKKTFLIILLLISATFSIFAQRTLFVGTIPLNGRIPLEETFTLEVTFQVPLLFNQEIAGGQYQIATYEFFSNSPAIEYQLKLSPGVDTRLGKGLFAFRSINAGGIDTGAKPIPFRLIVKNRFDVDEFTNDEYRAVEKNIGVLIGSRFEESGLIYVQFPSISEGFDINNFTSGLYEASIFVEVLAD